jgi:dolichyl-phosphate beta-glucosyltransferase
MHRSGPLTSLVIPAFNPGPVLDRTLGQVKEFLENAPGRWEVLFVCDGCTDGTPPRLAEWAQDIDGVRVLSYVANRGKGYAVRYGLQAARGEWRLFTDVDLAYRWDNILRLARVLRDGAEVAIASRTHPESELLLPARLQGYAFRRSLQSLALSTLVRCLLPLTQRDTQAGLKGLSARVAHRLLPQLSCDGFGFDCELLTACAQNGFVVTEVPVRVRYEDHASTTNLRAKARMLWDLWQIRRAWRRRPGISVSLNEQHCPADSSWLMEPLEAPGHVEPSRVAA